MDHSIIPSVPSTQVGDFPYTYRGLTEMIETMTRRLSPGAKKTALVAVAYIVGALAVSYHVAPIDPKYVLPGPAGQGVGS